jgi:hypothetical protein
MAADTASGGLGQLETHYDTFIVSHPDSTFTTMLMFCRLNKTSPKSQAPG